MTRYGPPGAATPKGGTGNLSAMPGRHNQVSALTATEFTNSPNQDLEAAKMRETGERGGNGEIAGIAHGMWVVEGCGGM